MLYLDENVVEDMGAEALIGAECPFSYADFRAAWWRGQKERGRSLKMLNRCNVPDGTNERMM